MTADPAEQFHSLDWHQAQAQIELDRGYGQQVDSTIFLMKAAMESWQRQERHFDVMVIDRDLNSRRADGCYINFLFAAAQRGSGFVLSLARLNNIPAEQYLPVIRKLAAHEFGHVLGLVERDYNFVDIIGRHCRGEKGPCLMRQSLSLELFIRQHLEEEKAGQEICPDCVQELQSNRRDLF